METIWGKNPRNLSFSLRHVDPYLIHTSLNWPHSPPQTTSESDQPFATVHFPVSELHRQTDRPTHGIDHRSVRRALALYYIDSKRRANKYNTTQSRVHYWNVVNSSVICLTLTSLQRGQKQCLMDKQKWDSHSSKSANIWHVLKWITWPLLHPLWVVFLRPVSDTHQSCATFSLNFVVQQSWVRKLFNFVDCLTLALA